MDTNDVPMALRHRLGEPATAGLVELLDGTKREWTADVIAIVGERFERRLVAETVTERSNAATEERLKSGHAVGGGQYR